MQQIQDEWILDSWIFGWDSSKFYPTRTSDFLWNTHTKWSPVYNVLSRWTFTFLFFNTLCTPLCLQLLWGESGIFFHETRISSLTKIICTSEGYHFTFSGLKVINHCLVKNNSLVHECRAWLTVFFPPSW